VIARLTGRVADKLEDRVILDVGGVGYEVFTPGSTLARVGPVGSALVLHTVTHVREDAIHLYGFINLDEKRIFESVTAVSGIGPKLGLAVLSGLSPPEFRKAIVEKNIAALTAISGIGRKTAERMVVDLRDRMSDGSDSLPQDVASPSVFQDAVTALVTLGYPRAAAIKAVRQSLEALDPDPPVEVIVRRALGHMTTRA
jgi:Holliday junction DNA helicase RuvA